MYTAHVVLFVVDVRDGLAPLDEEVAQRLRGINKPVILVANKADHEKLDAQADEFYRLGIEPLVPVSTLQKRNKPALLDAIAARLPDTAAQPLPEPEMKVAIVGRRNVGKSTFINTLVAANRMIVSEVPGTTRDSVDVRFELDGHAFLAIDTPGVRKRKSIRRDIEFYGLHRAQRSIRRADVVLMFFDAAEEISSVDKQLTKYIEDQFKPCLFVVNKWDLLVQRAATGDWADYLRDTFPTMAYVPIAFITAQTGKNVKKLLNHAQMLFKQSRARIATGALNRLVRRAVSDHPPPVYRNRNPKVFFATQAAIQPPTIVVMCSDPKAFSGSYRRYLLGVLRDELEFGEVPIRLHYEKRSQHEGADAGG